MRKIEIEICAYSTETCLQAALAGATRVELCSSFAEGGLTPSAGAIMAAREVEGLQLSVMIRPRGGDFIYNDEELAQMLSDIAFAKQAGADGVVLGVLTPDGDVDTARTAFLVEAAAPMRVTFHRAFDMVRDWRLALEDVIAAGCHRILTSGTMNTAEEGIGVLAELTELSAGRIDIMAGSGVNERNAEMIVRSGVSALHFSGAILTESPSLYRNPNVNLSHNPELDYKILRTDPAKIRKIVEIVEQIN